MGICILKRSRKSMASEILWRRTFSCDVTSYMGGNGEAEKQAGNFLKIRLANTCLFTESLHVIGAASRCWLAFFEALLINQSRCITRYTHSSTSPRRRLCSIGVLQIRKATLHPPILLLPSRLTDSSTQWDFCRSWSCYIHVFPLM